MERGVVIGGLMICGSFLLAAMLNRSAMEERPAPAPVPIEAVVPVSPPAVQPAGAGAISDCADVNTRADAHGAAVEAEPPASDLMVNGREACPR
ncbi:hypothetical protein ACFPN2_19040 [Steroidobacter flavus]|uniref:Secreted protein n=1 Tax=Steroidobacter flavus TaxID=1842136 RepID=A0ABV8SW44_9GAMM